MKAATIAALDAINGEFYTSHATAFARTRQTPWPGWQRLEELLHERGGHRRHSILDVGCGNGRFGSFLEHRRHVGLDYLGLDSSLPLLAAARPALPRARLLAADCIRGPLPLTATWRFDLVTAFGLMHHVPSWERRRTLLLALSDRVAAGGVLAVAFWRFDADARLASRVVPWNDYNRTAIRPIDEGDLEVGDHLLRWGVGEALRYCHLVDTFEAAELTAALGLTRLLTFTADGAGGGLNLYHVLGRPRAAETPESS